MFCAQVSLRPGLLNLTTTLSWAKKEIAKCVIYNIIQLNQNKMYIHLCQPEKYIFVVFNFWCAMTIIVKEIWVFWPHCLFKFSVTEKPQNMYLLNIDFFLKKSNKNNLFKTMLC